DNIKSGVAESTDRRRAGAQPIRSGAAWDRERVRVEKAIDRPSRIEIPVADPVGNASNRARTGRIVSRERRSEVLAGLRHECPRSAPSAEHVLDNGGRMREEALALAYRHGINGIGEDSMRNHSGVVPLFNCAVERVLNHLA